MGSMFLRPRFRNMYKLITISQKAKYS